MGALHSCDNVLGLKIGKTTVAAVMLRRTESGWEEQERFTETHQRTPGDAVKAIWARLDHARLRMVVATGTFATVLNQPAEVHVPRDAALIEACKRFFPSAGETYEPLNLLRISASGFGLLTRTADGQYAYCPAERCSAGTGDAIEKLCARAGFKDNVAGAVALAEAAEGVVPINARCAAFAQSDFTHLANQGEDIGAVLRGYFSSIAGIIYALFENRCVSGRVIVIGGVAKNPVVLRSLQECIERDLHVHPDADHFEAWGAALIAATIAQKHGPKTYSHDPATIIRPRERTIRHFAPLPTFAPLVTQMTEPDRSASAWHGSAILGIDSGSTGTKAALIDVESATRVWDSYRPTESKPVAAAQAIVRTMYEAMGSRVRIVGIGLTGSGREAVGAVVRATVGTAADRLLVETEISAHARGACYYDPEGGRNLGIGEFGGQDVKYILLQNGSVTNADLNKACSAGTGSEIEYDANRLGVSLQAFGRLALASQRPIDIGQTCVVFSADIADQALGEGYLACDLAAGRYYFTANNWRYRLVGQMPLGEKLFVLGMPVHNRALPLAIAAVTGRAVIVPPRPGATGAIGIALLAQEQFAREGVHREQPIDLKPFLTAQAVDRSVFPCTSRDCSAGCEITRTKIHVNEKVVTVRAGGMCPLHEGGRSFKLSTDAPKPFQERLALHREFVGSLPTEREGQPRIAIPWSLANVRLLPLFATFFAELGMNVRVEEPTRETLALGERLCTVKDMCAPVKVAHGLVASTLGKTDFVFFPRIVTLPRHDRADIGCTCPLVQAAPELIAAALNGIGIHAPTIPILRPILQFSQAWEEDPKLQSAFVSLGRSFGKTKGACLTAFRRAAARYAAFQEHCQTIGTRALRYAEEHHVPAVVVLGRLYAVLAAAINGRIPEIIQGSGVVAIPVDCYPTGAQTPILDLVYWGEGQRNLRAVVDLHRRHGVYPLWLTCYACGPDAFLEHWFRSLANVPHSVIETDGHVGMGGFTTRIQSAVHDMRRHLAEGDRRTVPDLSLLSEHNTGKPADFRDPGSAMVVCQFGNLEPLVSAVFASAGVRIITAPTTNDEILRLGRQYASGKECVPYLYVTGVLEYLIREVLPRYRDIAHFFWVMPATTGPCRFGAYRTQHGMLLKKLGVEQWVHLFSTSSDDAYTGFGRHLRLKVCACIALADALDELRCFYLPMVRDPRELERVFAAAMARSATFLRGQPIAQSVRTQARDWFRVWGIPRLLRECIGAFQAIAVDPERVRRVATIPLAGEIYVVRDTHANKEVVEKLARHAIRVRRSTIGTWIRYLTWTQRNGVKRERFDQVSVRLTERLQQWIFWNIDRQVASVVGRETHVRIEPLLKAAVPYLGTVPEGEAILTIGELLNGGLAVGPQGCMPSKIAEAQLHHAPGSRAMTLYVDGDPIDDRRLASFAWKIHADGIDSLPWEGE